MRIAPAWCGHASTSRISPVAGARRRVRSGLAAATCALALGACAPEYKDYGYSVTDSPAPRSARLAKPLVSAAPPSRALLAQQPKPDCEAETADAQKVASLAPPSPDPNADIALRIKLEYERECYKQAESRVRTQLQRLQAWTVETIKASSRSE